MQTPYLYFWQVSGRVLEKEINSSALIFSSRSAMVPTGGKVPVTRSNSSFRLARSCTWASHR
jgi:hypothetical protein